MRRLVLVSVPLLALSGPVLAADLYGPMSYERDIVIERPAARFIERERIVEHHHHHYYSGPASERRMYLEPRYYAPRIYAGDAQYHQLGANAETHE